MTKDATSSRVSLADKEDSCKSKICDLILYTYICTGTHVELGRGEKLSPRELEGEITVALIANQKLLLKGTTQKLQEWLFLCPVVLDLLWLPHPSAKDAGKCSL